jgi:hypothetical protein
VVLEKRARDSEPVRQLKYAHYWRSGAGAAPGIRGFTWERFVEHHVRIAHYFSFFLDSQDNIGGVKFKTYCALRNSWTTTTQSGRQQRA